MPSPSTKKKKSSTKKPAKHATAKKNPVATPAAAKPAPHHRNAGFLLRLAAFIIDWFIIGLISSVATSALFVSGITFPYMQRMMDHPTGWIVGWLYFAIMESSHEQATFGKLILGITVTDMQGRRISFARASARFFSKVLSAAALGIGFLMIAFTPRKQGLHDIIAETLVVRRPKRT